jgi:flagellar biogenesis protein FliO
LVCVLLLAALLLLRYLRLIRRPAQDGLLSVVAQTSLSQQHTVYLVQAAGRYLLLGGAPGGLSLLGELPASTLPPPARPGVAPRRGDAQRSVTDDEEDEAEEDMPAMVARPPAPTSQQAGPKGP